jgi:hypothetical protein
MPNKRNSGIYTAEMGQPPKDIDGASAGMGSKPRPVNMAGTKVPVSPAAKQVVDESMRHYKGKK